MLGSKTIYSGSMLASITMHILVFALLFFGLTMPSMDMRLSPEPVKIIKAVTIDQAKVQAEMQQLKRQEEQKRMAEQVRQQKLLDQVRMAQKAREQEQVRLEKLKVAAKQAQQQAELRAKQQAEKLAQLKKQQADEQQRIALLKKQQAEEAKKQQQEQKRMQAEKELQQALARQKAEEQVRIQALQQQRLLSAIVKYKALITQAIGQNWIIPDKSDKTLSCKLLIRLAPDGKVLNVQLANSSGDSVLDRSALAAVYKASPLPVPSEPDLFEKFQELSLTVRPEAVVSQG